ncbi:MAG: Holliday junction resolvase RuvX [Acidimicrobiales bacterium]|nr:Holliday junction resolvase RuvX [Acidimicrobiales bacterium]
MTTVRALGLDLGQKRVGVAVSDSAGALAMPIEVLDRLGDRPREHRVIAELVEEWEVEIVVVGLPYNMDGSAGSQARKYASEAKALGDTLDVPVVLYDERLTTVTAERNLMEQNMNAQERRSVVDKVAASVMLQSWLDAGQPMDSQHPCEPEAS